MSFFQTLRTNTFLSLTENVFFFETTEGLIAAFYNEKLHKSCVSKHKTKAKSNNHLLTVWSNFFNNYLIFKNSFNMAKTLAYMYYLLIV